MTPQELATATGARIDRAKEQLPFIESAMDAYDINTPQRQAAFLAQVGHECAGFKFIYEIWGPTASQSRYEVRQDLGNVKPGDGYRYRGRGWIQLTGRDNYRKATERLRAALGKAVVPDFEAEPDQVATPKWAAMTAADFWLANGCNELADAGDPYKLCRKINGGLNGIHDRIALYRKACEVFNVHYP